MNTELLNRLYKEAHNERQTEDFSGYEYTQRWFVPEKFMELIVEECIALCDDHSERKIRRHFGVE